MVHGVPDTERDGLSGLHRMELTITSISAEQVRKTAGCISQSTGSASAYQGRVTELLKWGKLFPEKGMPPARFPPMTES